jgi:hypothetical protein
MEDQDRKMMLEGKKVHTIPGIINQQQGWGASGDRLLHRPSQPDIADDEVFGTADGGMAHSLVRWE